MKYAIFFIRFFFLFLLLVVPIAGYIQMRNVTMEQARKVKNLEGNILIMKKDINNLEQELSEQIDYRQIERLARKRHGLAFIYENQNPVVVVREQAK
jgi:cell division protein FtsB